MIIRKYINVTGIVQGVFYRQSTVTEAVKRNLTGWVKNMDDGSVTAEIQGEEDAVNELIEWCKTGPKHATVDRITEKKITVITEEGFNIRS